MTRRASSRHSPLREPPGLSYVRHHPYPGIQRRTSISQLHRLPPPSPPHPSGSRRASHDLRLSPARSGEVPMSGGSAFGQINLLADVAASQATTASLDRGTMPTHGGPATRSVSAARRDESGRGIMVTTQRGRRDAVADEQWTPLPLPQPHAPPTMRRQQAPPPPLQYPLRPAHVAPIRPASHPLAGLTLDREYAPYIPGKFEEDCRKVLHTPTLLYAPKPLVPPSQARSAPHNHASQATASLPPQWPPQMAQVHGKANPDKGVGWIYPFSDGVRPPSTRSPSHSFMTYSPLPQRPPRITQPDPLAGSEISRHTPPLSQDGRKTVPDSHDDLRPVTTKYWALPTPVTSSQPEREPTSPIVGDPNAMQVNPHSPPPPMPYLTIPPPDMPGAPTARQSENGSVHGSDMFLSPDPGDSNASMSGSDNGDFVSHGQDAFSRTTSRSSSIASAPLVARERFDVPSPTRSLPSLVFPSSIRGAAGVSGDAVNTQTGKRKSVRRHGGRGHEQRFRRHQQFMTAEGQGAHETARKLVELQDEVTRLREENDTLKRKMGEGESQ